MKLYTLIALIALFIVSGCSQEKYDDKGQKNKYLKEKRKKAKAKEKAKAKSKRDKAKSRKNENNKKKKKHRKDDFDFDFDDNHDEDKDEYVETLEHFWEVVIYCFHEVGKHEDAKALSKHVKNMFKMKEYEKLEAITEDRMPRFEKLLKELKKKKKIDAAKKLHHMIEIAEEHFEGNHEEREEHHEKEIVEVFEKKVHHLNKKVSSLEKQIAQLKKQMAQLQGNAKKEKEPKKEKAKKE